MDVELRDEVGQVLDSKRAPAPIGALPLRRAPGAPLLVERQVADHARLRLGRRELAGQAHASARAADDQAALGGSGKARERARRVAEDGEQDERRQPQRERRRAPQRSVDQRGAQQPRDERAARAELEELGQLVERRLVEDQLVAVVEAEHLAREDDSQQAADDRGAQPGACDDPDRERHGQPGREDVGED